MPKVVRVLNLCMLIRRGDDCNTISRLLHMVSSIKIERPVEPAAQAKGEVEIT